MAKSYFLRRAILFIFLLFLVCASSPTHAQGAGPQPELRFTHLTIEEGLSHNHVKVILQDRYGFMWFGTWGGGLDRYDGYRVTSYRHDLSDPHSLSNNVIEDLLEDRDGMLWVATRDGGLNRFDPRTQQFTRYLHDPTDPLNPKSLADNSIYSLAVDAAGQLWMGTGTGELSRFDPATETFTHYSLDFDGEGGIQVGGIREILVAPSGDLWLVAGNLIRFIPTTGQVTVYMAADNSSQSGVVQAQGTGAAPATTPGASGTASSAAPPPRTAPTFGDLYQDAAGNLWLGGKALYKFDPDAGQFVAQYPLQAGTEVVAMQADEEGHLWLGVQEGGLQTFDPQTERFIYHYRHDPTNPASLSNDRIHALYVSEEGIFWMGTVFGGVDRLDRRQSQFTYYRYDQGNPNSFSDPTLGAIYQEPEGALWVGTQSTLNRLDRATGQMTHYEVPGTPVGHPEIQWISRIYQDEQGYLWFDGPDGIYRFDERTETFESYRPEESPQGIGIWYMAVDSSGDFWLTTTTALYGFERETERFTTFRHDPEDEQSLSRGDYTGVYADQGGHVWVGSGKEILNRLDPETNKIARYFHAPAEASTIPPGRLQVAHEDADGTLWLGFSGGLARYDAQSDTFIRYAERDGLPSDNILGILGDQQGALWISTLRGLSRFDRQEGTFRNYDVSDGLQGTDFRLFSSHQAADGELFFGGSGGLTAFYPTQLTDNLYSPPVLLTDLRLFNEPVLPAAGSLLQRPIWQTEHLMLQHDQDILSFEFVSLSYAAPAKNRYRYQLEGLDRGWNEGGSDRRFVSYTNLPSGEYLLRVQGTNKDGIWSDKEATLAITVLPPWWERWWFRSLLFAAVVGLLLGSFRWRVYAIEQRNRELEREVALRTQALQEAKNEAVAANQAKSVFLANMSHELRSPLNAILGFSQLLGKSRNLDQEEREELAIIIRSGDHLLTLINQVLDLSKIEANRTTLNEHNFDLHRLLDELEDMFALKADHKRLSLLFERDAEVPQYIHTDEVKLRQVLINLLNNALKFTQEGGVAVRVGVAASPSSSPRLLFEVEDTGPGVAPEEMDQLFEPFVQTQTGRHAQEGTGLGLPISRRFVQLMGGDMTVVSQVGQGTRFKFDIRLQPASGESRAKSRARHVVGLEPGQPDYRILIVDDKESNRQLLKRLLAPFGFHLREAQNGQEAVDIWDEWDPHLIWMDMRMPVKNGYEAASEIKATTKGQATAIIALTASTFEEERALVLSAGCDEFLRKPFREQDIFDILQRHIGVRFVYEEPLSLAPDPALVALTAQEVALLPAEWRGHFEQALIQLDMQGMLVLIADLPPEHRTISPALKEMVTTFAYERLSRLFQEAAGAPTR